MGSTTAGGSRRVGRGLNRLRELLSSSGRALRSPAACVRGKMADSLWVLLPAAQRASGEWIDDTLKTRAQEKGLTARFSLAGQFPRNRVEVVRDHDPWARVNELFYRRGRTAQLPTVSRTLREVERKSENTN